MFFVFVFFEVLAYYLLSFTQSFIFYFQLADDTSILSDGNSTLEAAVSNESSSTITAFRSSFSSGNLQSLEQQLNNIYNSTVPEFGNQRLSNPNISNTNQFNSNQYASRTANFNFNSGSPKKYNCVEKQRSQSLPHNNTHDLYGYNSFRQNAQNLRLPVNNYGNAASTTMNYANSQYSLGQNDNLNANQTSTFDNSQYSTANSYNNAQTSGYSYAPENTTSISSQYQGPGSSQAGLPSPAPGTTAPSTTYFGHQHLPTARHCNCSNQHCNSHFYSENDDKMETGWQCGNNTTTRSANVCNQAQIQSNNINYNYRNVNQFNAVNGQDTIAMSTETGDFTNNYVNDMRSNYSMDTTSVNLTNNMSVNYNCAVNHEQSNLKYGQQHYQQTMNSQQQYQHQTQNQQFFQMQHDHPQQQQQQCINQNNAQQFKVQQQYHHDYQQQQMLSNFHNRRTSTGNTTIRIPEREIQSNIVSQSSLNMRPTAYERTLQYVEQCQIFSMNTTTNQNSDSSNMVIHDMSSSLNSLFEETKYLQTIQQ